jgi:hypothetical protein
MPVIPPKPTGRIGTGVGGNAEPTSGMRNGKRRTPKSATSSRAVPIADRVGGALDRLFQASAYQGDDDLVFGHPHTGRPLDPSQVSKRFRRSLQRACVRQVQYGDRGLLGRAAAYDRPGSA